MIAIVPLAISILRTVWVCTVSPPLIREFHCAFSPTFYRRMQSDDGPTPIPPIPSDQALPPSPGSPAYFLRSTLYLSRKCTQVKKEDRPKAVSL